MAARALGRPNLLPIRHRTPLSFARRFNRSGIVRGGPEDTYLTVEEAGIVELAALDLHEKFLARLTISSLNLLRKIAKDEGCAIEGLNAGKVVDWFVADKEKRDTDPDNATLDW